MLHYPDAFNPQVIGLSPLGNNAAEGAVAEVVLLVQVNGVPRELKVTNITKTNPVVVRALDNGLTDEDVITFNYVPGMSQLVGNSYIVKNASDSSFELYYQYGIGGVDEFTVLMMHNNIASFPDSEVQGTPKVSTIHGGVTLNTSIFRFNGGAAEFNGVDGYITYEDSPDWDLGSDVFTVDGWVYFRSLEAGTYPVFIGQYDLVGERNWELYVGVDEQKIFFDYSLNGSSTSSRFENWSPNINQWYHIAIVRNGTNLRTYIDGRKLSNGNTVTGAFFNSTSVLSLGVDLTSGVPVAGDFLKGIEDEWRVSKGKVRWLDNFQPPSEQYGDVVPLDGTSFSLFTEYSVSDEGVSYSQTRSVPLVLDPITGTYSAKLSKVNQEERVEGVEIARITQEDQSFLARAGYIQT